MNIARYLANTPPKEAFQKAMKRLWGKQPISGFDEEHPCIFVLSTGRVGSETLAALLSLSPNILALHEPRPLLYRLSKAAYQSRCEESDPMGCESFLTLRSEQFGAALGMGLGYVETSPQATFLAPIIASTIPVAKFIHLIRHPADVVRSGMRRGWYAGHSGDATRIVPRDDEVYGTTWGQMTAFTKNMWLWAETNRWIADFANTLPREKHLLVRSENLYDGDQSTLRSIYEFCGSSLPPCQNVNRVLGKRLNRQDRGDFPKYEDWEDSMQDLLCFAVGGVASRLGYTLDKKT